MSDLSRRALLAAGAAAAAAGLAPAAAAPDHALPGDAPAPRGPAAPRHGDAPLDLRFAVKDGMIGGDAPLAEKFAMLRDLGYDGVEWHSPSGRDPAEVLAASRAAGLPIHGVVDSIHWQTRLSAPDPETRARGRAALEGAIRDAHALGGSSVLLVPGVVSGPDETAEHVLERSIEEIRRVLPLAAALGIHILIENVWNRFLYDHDGDDRQSAAPLAAYLDAIDSPWVGVYFDLGNHRKYGDVAAWIRTLGSRIVKLDVKDWGREAGWARIGEGDVNWPEVRRALRAIGYTGWCTAEVQGGDRARLADVKARMDRALRGATA